ncbi:transmembrane protein, putative (macronuclear) [Tetrahymena thermophila SB210]|uniref:Transmembrane protein, putative n=1 Tax=Tetrahymena thermophila (strain SB210) TaxID=312017 RepID=I7MLM0_TETTS|nr:transmembrane protein, putative [Tetrahymena thermophila SB210]EAS02680.2 transmembrane protein, putative [Tetrahymena thermophila SB210]|eukprot:XP_001022925.2 transmembrane protein, putative [Tetrahymena thermophila SB210]
MSLLQIAINTIFIGLLLDLVYTQTVPTLDIIQTCEKDPTQMYAYNQCVNWQSNCSFIEGTISGGTCTKPTVTSTACLQPGFLINASNNCVDCRTEQQCLLQCDGFWSYSLQTCLRQTYKSFKRSNSGVLCTSFTNQIDCNQCRDQQFAFNSSTSKCLKCPPSQWNSQTMTCNFMSSCSNNSGLGLSTALSNCVVCYGETTQKYLSLFSQSCEVCPSECTQCGGYTNCLACQNNFSLSTDTTNLPGVCECKNAYSFDGSNCNPCKTNCTKCKGDGTCLLCSQNYGLNTSTNTCVKCAVFNTKNPTICDIPVLAFCQTPSSDGNFCLQCQQQNQVFDTVAQYCVCQNNQIQDINTGICSSCSTLFANCLTCTTTSCLSCTDPNFTLNNSTGCKCSGIIQNGLCLQCSNLISNCMSCSTNGQTCNQCFQGYGLAANNSSCYACNTIDPNCVSCNSSNVCSQCNNGYILNQQTNKCVCDTSSNQYALVNGFCYNCSNSLTQCKQCSVNSQNSGLICIACNEPFVAVNGQCQLCAQGFYQSGNQCLACSQANCKQCTSTDCYQCISGFTLNNNTCTCITPMIVDSDGICKTCSTKFGSLCQTCSTSACTTCGGINYTPNSTGCQCVKGVENTAQQTCVSCPTNCSTCTSNTNFTQLTCTLCSSGFKLMSDGTCSTCLSNQYYNSTTKTCNSCSSNCSGCADDQNGGQCSGCTNGFILSAQLTCVCNGSKALAADQVNCVNCSTLYGSNCATCDSSACLTCISNYYQNASGTCITCSSGQYFSNSSKTCVNCPSNCSACSPLTGVCTTCINNYDLNSQGQCVCQDTKVLNSQNSCISCSSIIQNCSTCSSTTSCSSCSSPYKLMSNNQCAQCGSSQYYLTSQKTCQNCPVNCSACNDDTALCTGNCLNNYRLDTTTSQCVCNNDRALFNNKCTSCSSLYANCTQCNSSQCTACNAPYVLTPSGCQLCPSDSTYISSNSSCSKCNSLIKNCLSCSSTTTCTACYTQPFKLSSDGSSCNCPDGNYLVPASQSGTNDQCIPCINFDQNCVKCSGNNLCTLCANTYFYDSSLQKCRQCNKNEYYNYIPSNNIQACINCNQLDPNCSSCSNSSTCTQCFNNYDLNSANTACICANTKILAPSPANNNINTCQLCSTVVDPHCLQCDSLNHCSQCAQNFNWDPKSLRCIPNIAISITNTVQNSQNNYAIGDTFQLQIIIPPAFQSSALNITILYYDSIEQYSQEFNILQNQNVTNENIPYLLNKCVVYSQDNLMQIPNPKYTKVTQSDGSTILQRIDNFLLHEGNVRFVYLVQSQNSSFKKYFGTIDISLVRAFQNLKSLSFQVNQYLNTYNQFSLYNIFYQIYIHNQQICSNDTQCNFGRCQASESNCVCNQNYLLFDCSDYMTFQYDQTINGLYNALILSNPISYQDVFVSDNLPKLVTSTSYTSKIGVQNNLKEINDIINTEIIDNNQQTIIDNMILNVMNSISYAIKNESPDFTANDISSAINSLEGIIQNLLIDYDEGVGYGTKDMQLLAKINRDPTRIITQASTKQIFDPTFDTTGELFEPSIYESVGLQISINRYSFKVNPHKLSNPIFKNQARFYPLIMYITSRQNQTLSSRMLQSDLPLIPFKINITFTFDVYQPQLLKNLVCLSLVDLNSDQYQLCSSIQIQNQQVICECENSATLYEDLNYHFLAKPKSDDNGNSQAPLSMVITVIVLSLLLTLLLIIQIRNNKSRYNSGKLDEAYAKVKAQILARKKMLQEQEQLGINTEMKEMRRSQVTQSNYLQDKSGELKHTDSIFNNQPIISKLGNNKALFYNSEIQTNYDDESPKKFQDNLDFYGINKQSVKTYDPNMATPGMEQYFDDKIIKDKIKRNSNMQFEDEESNNEQKNSD